MSHGQALDLSTVRVLVVEDDENNRIVLTRLLMLAGVARERILEAEGDAAAFLAAEGRTVDVVFLDLQLPHKDGYAIIEELRADPATKDLRIVALTANVMREDVERCRCAGFDGFLGKPLDGRRFKSLLASILEGQEVWVPT